MNDAESIDRGPEVSERLHRLIRRAVSSFVARYGRRAPSHLEELRRNIDRLAPAIASTFRNAQLMGWLQAAKDTAEAADVPKQRELPVALQLPVEAEVTPGAVRYPQIEEAARWVSTRVPFARDEYDQLDTDSRRIGFTVAGAVSEMAVRNVQRALAKDIEEGGTLTEFRRAVADDLPDVSPSQLEAIYRTTVGRACSAGQIAVLDHPLVVDEFPYLLYSATHDSRVREDHLEMERLGLNGTAVYRSDDPIWDLFFPPWSWNCRCVVVPLSVEDAAARGVEEAKKWQQTGLAPNPPEHVAFPPFRPPPGWVPTGRRLSAVM